MRDSLEICRTRRKKVEKRIRYIEGYWWRGDEQVFEAEFRLHFRSAQMPVFYLPLPPNRCKLDSTHKPPCERSQLSTWLHSQSLRQSTLLHPQLRSHEPFY